MNYSKPEVTVLGDASVVIQGQKQSVGDSSITPVLQADCELDD